MSTSMKKPKSAFLRRTRKPSLKPPPKPSKRPRRKQRRRIASKRRQ